MRSSVFPVFQVDVANHCGQAIIVSSGLASSIASGSIPATTLQNGQIFSRVNSNMTPATFQLYGSKGGLVYLDVALASTPNTSTAWPLFFDTTGLNSGLPGFSYMGTVPTFFPLKLGGGSYAYPSIQLSSWRSFTIAAITILSGTYSLQFAQPMS